MKIIAILLVIGSFLAGSFITVLDPREVNWSWMVPVLLIGTVKLEQLQVILGEAVELGVLERLVDGSTK